jgi:hypothetical protein
MANVGISKANCYYESAITQYSTACAFYDAAMTQQELADRWRRDEPFAFGMILTQFTQAKRRWKWERNETKKRNCALVIATVRAQKGEYLRAGDKFAKWGLRDAESSILRFSAKTHFMYAALCFLAADDRVRAVQSLARFKDIDPAFSWSREYDLVMKILAANSAEDVACASKEYEQTSRIPEWLVAVLLCIKDAIGEQQSIL